MSTSVLIYRLASGALFTLGFVHNLVELLQSRRPTAPELEEVERAMQAARVPAPGRDVTLYEFMKGFSYTMGFLFMAYGALGWVVAPTFCSSSAAMVINVGLCLVGLGLSRRYFFVVPTVFMGFSGACYAAAWLQSFS